MAKIRVTTPPEKKVVVIEKGNAPLTGNDPIRDQMDARDGLMTFIGQGYKGGKMTDDQQGVFKTLSHVMGQDKAQKLLSHVTIFNQRDDVQRQPLEQKVRTFFDMGSSNPEIASHLTRFKALNYGPAAALNNSPWEGLARLTGRGLATNIAPTPQSEKVKLLVQNLVKK